MRMAGAAPLAPSGAERNTRELKTLHCAPREAPAGRWQGPPTSGSSEQARLRHTLQPPTSRGLGGGATQSTARCPSLAHDEPGGSARTRGARGPGDQESLW